MERDNSLKSEVDRTVNAVGDLSNGGKEAAKVLMNEVDQSKTKYGNKSGEFQQYSIGVTHKLTENGVLPELALGYARNNFSDLDMDDDNQISKVELYIKNDRSDNPVEKAMLSKLIEGFQEVRDSHESNKYLPFGKDKSGITEDDLDAMLESKDSAREATGEKNEGHKKRNFVEALASDLVSDNGRMFLKLARGDRDSNRSEIEFDDLEDWLEKDDKAREYNSSLLTEREREITTFLKNNWDSESVRALRSETIEVFDPEGTEKVIKGSGSISLENLREASNNDSKVANVNSLPERLTYSEAKPEFQPIDWSLAKKEAVIEKPQEEKKVPVIEEKPVKWLSAKAEKETIVEKTQEDKKVVQKDRLESLLKNNQELAKPKAQTAETGQTKTEPDRLTDEQLQANTRAYLAGKPMPFATKEQQSQFQAKKVSTDARDVDVNIQQNIHVYPPENGLVQPANGPTIIHLQDGNPNYWGNNNRFQNQSRYRGQPYYGGGFQNQSRYRQNGFGGYNTNGSGSREYSRSSDYGSGGNLSFGRDREYSRENYNSGVPQYGYQQPQYNAPPPVIQEAPYRDGVDRTLDFLNGISQAAQPWLLWDAAKHSNKYGFGGGNNRFGYGRNQNIPRQRW